MKKQYISVAIATVAGIAMAVPVFAQDNNTISTTTRSRGMMGSGYQGDGDQENGNRGGNGRGMMGRPSAVGTVTAISGNTITISGTAGVMNPRSVKTTFTVDATNAKITKNNATSTVAGIVVGDTIFVQGVTSGTNIVATVIRDGNFARGNNKADDKAGSKNGIALLQGNGQPIIAGNVTAVSSTTITVTNKSNVTYTVDVTNAKVMLKNAVATTTSVTVGDAVIVQGTVNGNSVTASTVIDSGVQVNATSTQANENGQSHRGFFGGIASFFSRLFGF